MRFLTRFPEGIRCEDLNISEVLLVHFSQMWGEGKGGEGLGGPECSE